MDHVHAEDVVEVEGLEGAPAKANDLAHEPAKLLPDALQSGHGAYQVTKEGLGSVVETRPTKLTPES